MNAKSVSAVALALLWVGSAMTGQRQSLPGRFEECGVRLGPLGVEAARLLQSLGVYAPIVSQDTR